MGTSSVVKGSTSDEAQAPKKSAQNKRKMGNALIIASYTLFLNSKVIVLFWILCIHFLLNLFSSRCLIFAKAKTWHQLGIPSPKATTVPRRT
jgi:hypothetical protein